MARKINQAPSTQITQFVTDDILYVARPSGLSDHWIKAQKVSAIGPNEGDFQYYTGGNWVKTNGLVSWDGSQFTVNGVPVTVQDELVGGQAASAILQTPSVAEDGYIVSWDNTAGEFTLTPILESISLDQLSDVDLTGAADNDLLFRSGGNWIDTAGLLTWDGTKMGVGVLSVAKTAKLTIRQAADAMDQGIEIRSISSEASGAYIWANGFDAYFEAKTTLGKVVLSGGGNSALTVARNTTNISSINTAWWVSPNNTKAASYDETDIIFYEDDGTTEMFRFERDASQSIFSTTVKIKEITPPTIDVTGQGHLYASNVDGLIYWRDDVGNVYDLTAGSGGLSGATNEFQKNDGSGGHAGTKIFSPSDGNIDLGDSGLAGNRTISVTGLDATVRIILEPKGASAINEEVWIGSIHDGRLRAGFGEFNEGGTNPNIQMISTVAWMEFSSGTDVRDYAIGVEGNVSGDPFRISTGTDTDVTDLSTDVLVEIESSGKFKLKAGATTNFATIGGVIHSDVTAVGNVGSGEDTLKTFSIPADTVNVNGDILEFFVMIDFANNGNLKTVRIKFGATTILTTSDAAFVTQARVRVVIMRTGAATQKVHAEMDGATPVDSYNELTEDFTGAIDFVVTGEADSDDDIVMEAMYVELKPN